MYFCNFLKKRPLRYYPLLLLGFHKCKEDLLQILMVQFIWLLCMVYAIGRYLVK